MPHTFWGHSKDGVVLVTEGVGSVATFMTSEINEENMAEILRTVQMAKSTIKQHGVAVVHVLLAEFDEEAMLLYKDAGFTNLATLQYMEWSAKQTQQKPIQTNIAEFCETSTLEHQILKATLQQTFLGSLDCPKIHGKRSIEDILKSHQGFESNDLSLWFIILFKNEPAGVLLLNPSKDEQYLELAYLGITPEMRRKGLAKEAMHYAINLATKRGCNKIVLAVDNTNIPAITLYKKINFQETTKRIAMFCPLH